MAERFVDKQIKILELICKNDFREECVSNYGSEITDDDLAKILGELQSSNFLKIQSTNLISSPDDSKDMLNGNDIVIYYQIISKKQLANLLAKFRKNYPRHNKPIVREKTLEKIAKHFADIATREEIVELLKEWGVSKSIIEYQPTRWKMIFSVLNYYALSTKEGDFHIFSKIIEGIVHPLMLDGNEKETQAVIDMFNSRMEYDGLMIEDGHLQQIKNSGEEMIAKKLTFDEVKSLLKIDGKEIKIRKNGKQFLLLQALFSMRADWDYELTYIEIGKNIDEIEPPKAVSLKNAAYQLKRTISLKTGIKDFFIITNKTLTISSKYSPID